MNDIVDVIALLRLIQGYSRKIARYSALVEKMRSEGREQLTDDELNELRADDDASRDRLEEAIEAARQVS